MACDYCSICGELKFDWEEHRCPPNYYFKHEDWGDKFQAIRAWSFDDAAEKFAKKYNEDGDYALMNRTIEVLISDGEVEKKFSVTAEPDINYSVDELSAE